MRSLGPAVSPPPTSPEQTGNAADEASGHASLFHEAPLRTLLSTLPPQTSAETISLAPATSPPLVSPEQMGNTAEEASGDEEPPWSTQTSTLLAQTPPEVTSLAPAGSPATSKQTANMAEESSADASVLDEHAEPRGPSTELSGGFADATMMEPSAGDSTDWETAIASRRDLMTSTEDPVMFSVDLVAYSGTSIQDPLTFRENPTTSTEDPKTSTQDTITSIEDLMTSAQDSMTSTADPVTSPEEQMTYTQVPEASDDNSAQEVTVQERPGDDIWSAPDSTTSQPETTGGFEHDQAPSTRGGELSMAPASSPRSPEGHTPVEGRSLTQVQGENRPNYAQPGRPGRKGARKHAQRGRTSGKPPESARQSAEPSEPSEDQDARSPESGRQHGGPPSLVPTFRSIFPTAPAPVWTGEKPPGSTPSALGPRRRPGSRKRPRPHRFRPGSSPPMTSPSRVPNTQEPTLLKASPVPSTAQIPEKQRKHRKRPHRPPITAPAVTSAPWASTPNLPRDRKQDVAHSTVGGGLSWTTAPRDVVNSTNAEDSNDITVVGDNTASLKHPVSHSVVLDDVIGPAKSEGSDDVTGTEDSTDSLKIRPSHNAVTNDVIGPGHLEDSAGVVGLTNAQRSVDLIDPTDREDSDDVTDPANTEDSDDIVGVGTSAASEVHRSPQDVREAVPSTRHPDAEETKGYDVTVHAGDAKEKADDVTTGPDSGRPQSAPNSGSDTSTARPGDAPPFPRPTSAWTAAPVTSLAPTSGVPPTLSPTLLTLQPST
uniref:Uncharacterized protein n=2 Tax=Nannospalax galili TaxID=1026970 RepID=A0A8C6R9G2_NANGA